MKMINLKNKMPHLPDLYYCEWYNIHSVVHQLLRDADTAWNSICLPLTREIDEPEAELRIEALARQDAQELWEEYNESNRL